VGGGGRRWDEVVGARGARRWEEVGTDTTIKKRKKFFC